MQQWHKDVLVQARALLDGERDPVANAANLSALLWMEWPDISWVGFYFLQGEDMVLGPFHGKPACVRIAANSAGVCGAAVRERRAQCVEDVNAFPGHIACDPDSRSEIVAPLIRGDELLGVIDIDSPKVGRFNADDVAFAEALVEVFLDSLSQEHQRPAHL